MNQEVSRPAAIVTGAARGIGLGIARRLAADGCRVVIWDRDLAPLAAAEDFQPAFAQAVDVTDLDRVARAFEATLEAVGEVRILVNNAGINGPVVEACDYPADAWDRVLAVNLTGVFLCTQAAIRLMKDQTPRGGRIINNGSISADRPRPNSAPYTATKHAITGLTKSTSLDGRAHDIACGQIDIGNAATPMTAKMSEGMPQADGSIAPEPTFDVAEVGRAIVYMASLPLDANVQFMTIMATKMPYIGRG